VVRLVVMIGFNMGMLLSSWDGQLRRLGLEFTALAWSLDMGKGMGSDESVILEGWVWGVYGDCVSSPTEEVAIWVRD